MSKTSISKRPAIVMPTVTENKAIVAAAKSDPDAKPLSPKQLKAMVPIKVLRGRPKSENAKKLVSVRYSPEVLAYFRSTGEGWQSRMDHVLRKYVTRNLRRACNWCRTLVVPDARKRSSLFHNRRHACAGKHDMPQRGQ